MITKEVSKDNICVDLKGLMKLLNCGRNTAERIGKESNASFKIGKRKLYRVDKITSYVETLTEN